MSVKRMKPRVYLTLQQRHDILQQIEVGVPMIQLANDYNVNSMTIRRIRSNAAQIRQQSQLMGIKNQKKFRMPVLRQLDMRLYAWYLHRRTIDDHVTDSMLQAKAKELNEQFGGPSSFTGSRGWIWRFKRRHGINPPKYHDECTNNTGTEGDFPWNSLQQMEEDEMELENFYNMNEMDLAWRVVPRKTLEEKKVFKHRMTTHRLDSIEMQNLSSLVTYEYERSRDLMNCRNRLPVVFKARRNIWTDRNEFADWFENYFKPAVRRHQIRRGAGGKVFLLLDKCRINVLPPPLRRQDDIELVYFSTNMAGPPTGQEIVERTRRSFGRIMLRKILEFPDGVVEFYGNYYVRDCVSLINEIWIDTIQMSICKSCSKLLADTATKEQKTEEEENQINTSRVALDKLVGNQIENKLVSSRITDTARTRKTIYRNQTTERNALATLDIIDVARTIKTEPVPRDEIEECNMTDVTDISATLGRIKVETYPLSLREECDMPVTVGRMKVEAFPLDVMEENDDTRDVTEIPIAVDKIKVEAFPLDVTRECVIRPIKTEPIPQDETDDCDIDVTEISNSARRIKVETDPLNQMDYCEIPNTVGRVKVEPVPRDRMEYRDTLDITEISNTVRPIKLEVVNRNRRDERDVSIIPDITSTVERVKVEGGSENRVDRIVGNDDDLDIEFNNVKTDDEYFLEPDLDEEQTKKMFSSLALWSQDQPSFIQLQFVAEQLLLSEYREYQTHHLILEITFILESGIRPH
ncbi:uncharacterized protein LOC128873530 [Hylaeus volcanicus]|uniref:uncharacterized protein LOC128873530 n=1 Tax=Hylaeus volcanicus TaxID=313075 RepID=UPI0023B86E8B|nr:uncharacterized protein LOC128873530 [Hylaeus volcanicus]